MDEDQIHEIGVADEPTRRRGLEAATAQAPAALGRAGLHPCNRRHPFVFRRHSLDAPKKLPGRLLRSPSLADTGYRNCVSLRRPEFDHSSAMAEAGNHECADSPCVFCCRRWRIVLLSIGEVESCRTTARPPVPSATAMWRGRFS